MQIHTFICSRCGYRRLRNLRREASGYLGRTCAPDHANVAKLSELCFVAGLEPFQFGLARRIFVPDKPSIRSRTTTAPWRHAARVKGYALTKNPDASRRYRSLYSRPQETPNAKAGQISGLNV